MSYSIIISHKYNIYGLDIEKPSIHQYRGLMQL